MGGVPDALGGVTDGTPKKRRAFLDTLAEGLSVKAACEAGGFSRNTAYRWREEDPDFAKQWDDAVEAGTDILEDVAHRRAIEHSDTLTIFLLKARRKEKYADLVRNRLTGPDDGPVQIEVEDTRAPIDSLMTRAAAKAEDAAD